MVRLSVITPTAYRGSIDKTGRSAEGCHEWLVGGDGDTPPGWTYPVPQYRFEMGHPHWGGPIRNELMPLATGTHLSFMDDDDVYAPGAIQTIMDVVSENPDQVHIFRMRHQCGMMLPSIKAVLQGQVGTPCIVCPNVPEKLGVWGAHYEGDFQFISQTVEKFGGAIFREEIICVCRPQD